MQNDQRREFSIDYFLSAAECNAQQEMSLSLLAQRCIDIATAHANRIGAGYSRMLELGASWVLSRMTLEMIRMPRINESFAMTTWIQSVNRHFSERIVEIADAKGVAIGYGRLVWVGIDIVSRRPIDLTPIFSALEPSERACPIERQSRLTAIDQADETSMYRFRYSDIDFNRHVTSSRYVELMLDQWSLDYFDRNRVSRFEIAYLSEAHCDDVVEVRRKGDSRVQDLEIVNGGSVITRSRVTFVPRHTDGSMGCDAE